MPNKYRLYFLPILTLFLFNNCDIINPEEPIPSYIEINKINLSHESPNGIQDAWVDVNGELIGVFELPAKFPVIATGQSEIRITPGIKVNGINEQRSFYPYYEPIIIDANLVAGESFSIGSQTTTYTDWTKISFTENFENTNKFIKSSNVYSDTTIINYSDDSFEGNNCGAIIVDSTNTFFQIQTEKFEIPNLAGMPGMFLELNFKNTTPAMVGYYIFDGSTLITKNPIYMVLLPENTEWTKVYIDLYTQLIQYLNTNYTYAIVFNNYDTKTNANSKVLIDNVKIVLSE